MHKPAEYDTQKQKQPTRDFYGYDKIRILEKVVIRFGYGLNYHPWLKHIIVCVHSTHYNLNNTNNSFGSII